MSYVDKVQQAELMMPDRHRVLAMRSLAREADATIAQLLAALEESANEFVEIIEWHRLEATPLREQEIASVRVCLSAARAAIAAAKARA